MQVPVIQKVAMIESKATSDMLCHSFSKEQITMDTQIQNDFVLVMNKKMKIRTNK